MMVEIENLNYIIMEHNLTQEALRGLLYHLEGVPRTLGLNYRQGDIDFIKELLEEGKGISRILRKSMEEALNGKI